MHPANQRPRKPAQGAHKQTSYPRVQWGNTLDKREATDPRRVMKCMQRDTETEENVRSRNNQEYRTTHAAGS